MSHPEAATTQQFSTQKVRKTSQHLRHALFLQNKDNLPDHIKHMLDNPTWACEMLSMSLRDVNNELRDNLFVKRNGKWEMNYTAPIFEQVKVMCHVYRDGT